MLLTNQFQSLYEFFIQIPVAFSANFILNDMSLGIN